MIHLCERCHCRANLTYIRDEDAYWCLACIDEVNDETRELREREPDADDQ